MPGIVTFGPDAVWSGRIVSFPSRSLCIPVRVRRAPTLASDRWFICETRGSACTAQEYSNASFSHVACIQAAYFIISDETRHGDKLLCSYEGCKKDGSRFRYCAACRAAVATCNFTTRHNHHSSEFQNGDDGVGVGVGVGVADDHPETGSETAPKEPMIRTDASKKRNDDRKRLVGTKAWARSQVQAAFHAQPSEQET